MSRTNTIRLVARSARKLDESLVENLVLTLCACGDEPKKKCQALLVLIDELQWSDVPDEILMVAKRVTFSRLGEEDNEMVKAQIQFIRSELKT